MTPKEINGQLESIVNTDDFAWHSSVLVNGWISQGIEIEAVEPILQFMEKHPAIEYGMPGSLVNFAEKFYHNGYEQILLESVNRKPTAQTLLMLNRLINGTKDADTRERMISLMEQSRFNSQADEMTIEAANEFLEGF